MRAPVRTQLEVLSHLQTEFIRLRLRHRHCPRPGQQVAEQGRRVRVFVIHGLRVAGERPHLLLGEEIDADQGK